MRVLEINTVQGIGSTGKIATELYDMLQERGEECAIAYARGTAPERMHTIRIGNKFAVCLHGMMTRITDRHALYSVHATRRLVEQIKDYAPDLIHLHNLHGYYLDIRTLFAFLKEYDRPVVWTLHDCWSYTGHCAYYTNAGCEKWKSQCENCPLKKEYPASMLCDNSRENYKIKKELFTSLNKLQLVTPSEWLKGEVEQSFFQGIPCKSVPNGIELDTFDWKKEGQQKALKEKYGLSGKKVVLGVANVWEKRKGWDDFMKLPGFLPGDYQVVMVGLAEKQKKELPPDITGYPRTESVSQLADFYRMADVYFNGSFQETMGMTTGEAICCGTPAVVYRGTAVPESVGDGCGIIVEPGDVKAAAEAAVKLCENPAAHFEACKAYRSRFDKKIFCDAYYGIYQEMCKR
jgi:glycosyltransferase involved in cell wall biosynthesis